MISVGRTSGRKNGKSVFPMFASVRSGYRSIFGQVGGENINEFEPKPAPIVLNENHVIHVIPQQGPMRLPSDWEESARMRRAYDSYGWRGRKQKGCGRRKKREGILRKRGAGSIYFDEVIMAEAVFREVWKRAAEENS